MNKSRLPTDLQFHLLQESDLKHGDNGLAPLTSTEGGINSSTDSSPSLPNSFPYLYITEHTNSFDTYNMLNQNSSNDGPKYTNTTHITNPSDLEPQQKSPGREKGHQKQTSADESIFNQVPKRFSQFILDQQNPYVAQRLDNLSVESPYTDCDGLVKNTKRTFSSNSKKTSVSKPSKSENQSHAHSHTLSREISNSMGSQATIFSTRPDSQPLLENPRSRSGRFKFKRARSSKVKARLYTVSSSQSSLVRNNAIKFKKGSFLYRLKIRLQKAYNKLKNFKFNNFTVSSKRPGRAASVKRVKSSTLQRKYPKKPQQRPFISAPSTNPYLGSVGVQRVRSLTDTLKYSAGAPAGNVNIPMAPIPEAKYNHISTYIDEQQNNYANSMFKDQGSPAIYGRNMLDPRYHGESPSLIHEEGAPSSVTGAESEAPPPPPHLEHHSLIAPIIDENKDVVELWRSYLSHVLCKRIQLRQEINLFREFMERNETGGIPILQDDETTIKSSVIKSDTISYSETDVQSDSDSPASIASSDLDIESDSPMANDIFVDPPSKEFDNKFINRRSMLGEMLEYDSETELNASSNSTNYVSRAQSFRSHSSFAHSDISVLKKYGTVVRKQRSEATEDVSIIRRSTGVQDLSSIFDEELNDEEVQDETSFISRDLSSINRTRDNLVT